MNNDKPIRSIKSKVIVRVTAIHLHVHNICCACKGKTAQKKAIAASNKQWQENVFQAQVAIHIPLF